MKENHHEEVVDHHVHEDRQKTHVAMQLGIDPSPPFCEVDDFDVNIEFQAHCNSGNNQSNDKQYDLLSCHLIFIFAQICELLDNFSRDKEK